MRDRLPRLLRAVPALTLIGGLVGACGGGASTPQNAVAAYANAVDHDNAERAWALTAPAHRAATPRSRFDAEFAARVDAGPDFVETLDRASRGDASLSASLDYTEYESVHLEFVDGRWLITDGVGNFFSQATPRDTLRTFIRAVETADSSTLLRLVPGEFRSRIEASDLDTWMAARTEELAETVALLQSSADAPIRERDSEATLRYGAREMVFALENGRWVIADFD